MQFGSRKDRLGPGPLMYSCFDHAAPFELDGPWQCVGVSLSPFGWAALTQKPADQYRNRVYAAGEILGPEFDVLAERLVRAYLAGKLSELELAVEIAEWIRPRLHPIPGLHQSVIEKTLAWLATSLNPPVEELFYTQPYSRRQVERLVLQYFGLSPRALARKYRAIRAANLLAIPDLTDEGEAAIASAFFDQPHMVREIRKFCGHTPSRLGGEGDPMFHQLLKLKNMDRLKEFRNIGWSDGAQGGDDNDSQ
jgi:AraC-like DNA-binding protein